jgi:hypothetical protein
MGSYKTHGTITEIDRMALSSWYEGRSVPRSTAFKLVKLAGIETAPMKVATSRAPVAGVNAEQIQQLDALAQMLQNGVTMAQLERQMAGALVAAEKPAETVSDDPGPVLHPADPSALLARLEAAERAIASGLGLSTSEAAWILGVRPGAAVVTRGGITATRTARNCWQLRRSETV